VDAIELLKKDHRTVDDLFKRIEKAGSGATKTKRNLAERIIKELSVHAVVEETVFYPAVREASDEIRDDVLESLEEHHIVKWVLNELDGMDPEHERFDAKATVLAEMVRHHVEEEEKELFPKVRKALDAETRKELGEVMRRAKQGAPTRPHPRSPDEPPGNLVAGAFSSLLDRIRDGARGMARDAATAAERSGRASRSGRATKGRTTARATARKTTRKATSPRR
jgi:hemerythrin superfamily protein